MKGKYAKRAAVNRDFDAAERRALEAEHERDRLAKELDALRAKHAEVTAAQREKIATLQSERDTAASPRVTELEELNARLRGRWLGIKIQRDAEVRCHDDAAKHMRDVLVTRFGMTPLEAAELVERVWWDGQSFLMRPGASGSRDPRLIAGAQRMRGERKGVLPTAHARVITKREARDWTARWERSLEDNPALRALFVFCDPPWGILEVTQYEPEEFAFVVDAEHGGIGIPALEARKLAAAILSAPGDKSHSEWERQNVAPPG